MLNSQHDRQGQLRHMLISSLPLCLRSSTEMMGKCLRGSGHSLLALLKENMERKFPQFSHSLVSDSLRPHGLQHARLPCPFNHLILCCPLLLLPSIIPSFRVFSNESVLSIRWPKYWNFSFGISPSNEYSGLISFKFSIFKQIHYTYLRGL